jgi:hypothetical protein
LIDLERSKFVTTAAHLYVLYDGLALAQHEMDVRELAPAILAIGQLIEEAHLVLNGERGKVEVRVKGSFQTGSFGIDFSVAQTWADQLLGLLQSNPVVSAATMVTLLGFTVKDGFIQLIRWVNNRKITKIVILDHERVRVEIDGDHREVEQKVIDLYRNYKLRKAFEAALAPLSQDAVDSFAVTVDPDHQHFVTIQKTERRLFKTPDPADQQIADEEFDLNVQTLTIAFQEDNKWRFTDGNSTYNAAIHDVEFLEKIAKNEIAFAKGDVLRVRMRKQQWMTGEKMKTDYEVLRVLEHRPAAHQLPLPIEDQRSAPV